MHEIRRPPKKRRKYRKSRHRPNAGFHETTAARRMKRMKFMKSAGPQTHETHETHEIHEIRRAPKTHETHEIHEIREIRMPPKNATRTVVHAFYENKKYPYFAVWGVFSLSHFTHFRYPPDRRRMALKF